LKGLNLVFVWIFYSGCKWQMLALPLLGFLLIKKISPSRKIMRKQLFKLGMI